MSQTPDPPTVPDELELCVRSLSPSVVRRPQQRVVERLERLAEGADLDADVSVWGERVCLDDEHQTTAGRAIRERVERFRSWASENDRTLAPTFERRSHHSSLTDERYDDLVLPVMVLAEYCDGSLSSVAPSDGDDGVVTVLDRLNRLEAAGTARQVA
jgi:hypothetical protein